MMVESISSWSADRLRRVLQQRRKPAGRDVAEIVLLGAGHAHVEVLRRFAMRPDPTIHLTLIGREPETPYSGMLPGLIRGDYTFDQAHIDLAPLASMAQGRLIVAEAEAIDLESRSVLVAGRPPVGFDLLSIDIGGSVAMPEGAGTPVKPIGRFLSRLAELERRMPEGARLAVVGAGAAGAELSLALARRLGARVRIALVSEAPEPVREAPEGARRRIRAALVEAGAELACGVRATGFAAGRLALSDGSTLDAAEVIWATGVAGPTLLAASGLECDAAGCVRVDAGLRSLSHRFVFAAGDCASVEGAARPKAGVWAVRAGAPLAGNLRRRAHGRKRRRWRSQRAALVILGLGDGQAVAWRNGLWAAGHWVWRWKDWIDRRWMRMYQEPAATMNRAMDGAEAMRCGGCGAKVGAEVLAGALASLPRMRGADVLIGMDAADDAAVMAPPPGRLLVQSVDHFRAFLDDPFVFGQIAAAHALSDLHAMGARPWTAMAIAAVPYAESARMRAQLSEMLQGATEVLQAEGCALVGGHSGEGMEPSLGFAVSGLCEPGRLFRKSGLRAGDVLVLTKPLGTGIVLAGHMRGLARTAWLMAALDSMRASNGGAVPVLRAHGVAACTDVTGFGLAGHLLEMLRASGVGSVLWPESVPVLPGALELASRGVASTLAPQNAALFPSNDAVAPVLVDPQTSGGLLAGVPAARAEACLTALHDAGIAAAPIGVVEAGAAAIRLERVRPVVKV
jgi:selenide,water dikinase